MANKKSKKTLPVETPTKADLAKDYALFYEVLKTKNAKPVQLIDCRVANPGQKFRAVDVLCFPTQLDTLLAKKEPWVRAVRDE